MADRNYVLTPSQYFKEVTGRDLPLHTLQEVQDGLFLLGFPEVEEAVKEDNTVVVVGFINEHAVLEYRLMPKNIK